MDLQKTSEKARKASRQGSKAGQQTFAVPPGYYSVRLMVRPNTSLGFLPVGEVTDEIFDWNETRIGSAGAIRQDARDIELCSGCKPTHPAPNADNATSAMQQAVRQNIPACVVDIFGEAHADLGDCRQVSLCLSLLVLAFLHVLFCSEVG
eukprot:symbB.v1.2.033665.t1/scaffold4214.1/size43011/7